MSADAAAVRTLIVDDDPGARRLHEAYVRRLEGFVVVASVGHGSAAAEWAARPDIDLVLLDMNLPDFSGVEVLHRVRTARGSDVDVLVISSATDRTTVRQALSARVVGYLVKPFTAEALHDRLRAYRADRAAAAGPELDVPLAQGEIDGMLRPAAGAPAAASPLSPVSSLSQASSLPKGLSQLTLDRVTARLDAIAPRTCAEVAELTGTSAATARRYLDHLVRSGRVDVSHRYGRRGRPEVLYRLAP